MLKITHASCLSPAISSQFTFEMCAAAKNCKNFNETPLLGVQSCSRSLVDKSEKPVTSVYYDMQQVCTYLQPFSHYKSQYWQNNVFLRVGTPL